MGAMGWRAGGIVTWRRAGAVTLALAVVGLFAAATPMRASVTAAGIAAVDRDTQPRLSEAPSASSQPAGDDARDDDNDDDADDDASLVSGAVAVEPPQPSRLPYRPAANDPHAPPDAQPLLRPPSADVG